MAKTERRPLTDDDIAALPYRPCVGVMVLNRRGEIFAGQRVDNPTDAWQMPQGGIDKGEAPFHAALRELGEETGIAADRVSLLAESAHWLPYDLPRELIGVLLARRDHHSLLELVLLFFVDLLIGKTQLMVADRDDVTVLQRVFFYQLAVDVSAIGAVEILKKGIIENIDDQ